MTQAVLIPRKDGEDYDSAELEFVNRGTGDASIPITSHQPFSDLIIDAARTTKTNAETITSLKVRRWEFDRDETVDWFRVRLLKTAMESELSCTVKTNLTK